MREREKGHLAVVGAAAAGKRRERRPPSGRKAKASVGLVAGWLRRLRKTLTFGGLRVGMEFSRRADGAAVEALRVAALGATRITIPLRMRLRTNMKLAGVYRPGLEGAYFERAIDQMIMLAHVFRAGFPESGCPEKFRFDDSIRHLVEAYSAGRGVICIAPHLCGYPLYA